MNLCAEWGSPRGLEILSWGLPNNATHQYYVTTFIKSIYNGDVETIKVALRHPKAPWSRGVDRDFWNSLFYQDLKGVSEIQKVYRAIWADEQ